MLKSFSNLTMFEEKLKKIELEREILRECEKRMHHQEKDLHRREVELQKNTVEMKLQQEMFIRTMNEYNSIAPLSESSRSQSSVVLEETLTTISTKLEKLDKLDHVMNRLDSISPMLIESPKRTVATIRSEIERLATVILNDNVEKRAREAANMKIDRLYVELFATEEYKADVKRDQEERSKINDPLNQVALKNMLEKIINGDEEFRIRRKQYLALQLIGLDKDIIMGKHQSDYNVYPLSDLSEEELRAIRASLPTYRKEQRRQLEFVEALELRIQQVKTLPIPSEKIKRSPSTPSCLKFSSPKLRLGHGRVPSMVDLVTELTARKASR